MNETAEIKNYTIDELTEMAADDLLLLKCRVDETKRVLDLDCQRASDDRYRGVGGVPFGKWQGMKARANSLGQLAQRIQIALRVIKKTPKTATEATSGSDTPEQLEKRRAQMEQQRDQARLQRDEAQAACRRLAAEVETLTAKVAAQETNGFAGKLAQAFVDVAQIALAETTFDRVMTRARERIAAQARAERESIRQ